MVLWSGNLVSIVGTYGARIAYPLAVLHFSGSPALAGWVSFAVAAPGLLFQVLAGIVADRSDRRLNLLACSLIALLAAGSATACVLFHPGYVVAVLIACAAVEGTASAFFGTSEIAAVRDIVSEPQRLAAFSYYEAEQPVGIAVGRALGAALYGVGRALPFLADGLSYVYSIASLSAVRGDFSPRAPGPGPHANRAWSGAVSGIRILWNGRFLRDSAVLTSFSNLVIQFVIILVLVGGAEAGWPAWVSGAILAGSGIGGILASFVAVPIVRRFRSEDVYAAGQWAMAACVSLVALSTRPWLWAVAMFSIGAVGTISSVAVTVYRVGAVPDSALGSVIGTCATLSNGGVALGGLAGGFALEEWGVSAAKSVLAAVMLAIAILAVASVSRPNRNDPLEPAEHNGEPNVPACSLDRL